ncbi:RNA-binding S4 domain-containing protein [Eubacterium ramulus]
MEKVIIRDDFIKLGQAMKLAGMVGSGVDAKMLIQDGQVDVNGEVEYQRGKKLHEGDVITFNGESVQIGK